MRITNAEIMRRFPDMAHVNDSQLDKFRAYAEQNYGVSIPAQKAEQILRLSIDWDIACMHFIDGGRIIGRRYR